MPSGEGFADANLGKRLMEWSNGFLPNFRASRGNRAGAAGYDQDAGDGLHVGSWGGAAVFDRGAVPEAHKHGTGGWDVRGGGKEVLVRKDDDAAD